MSSSEGKYENTKSRTILVTGVCLCCLIIGFLLGIALDAKYRPNNIELVVGPDNKLTIAPEKGDIIRWSAADPSVKLPQVNFTAGLAPCLRDTGIPGVTCVYDPIEHGPSRYLSGCGADRSSNTCAEAMLGPKCPICPPAAPPEMAAPSYWETAFGDILRLIGPMKDQPMPPQNTSGTAEKAVPETLAAHELAAKLSPPLPRRVIEVAAACDSDNKPAVFPSGSSTPVTSITAEPMDTITWNRYKEYSISGLESVCTQGDPGSSGSNQSCTIKDVTSGGVPYMLNMTCGGVAGSTQETIQIQNPTVIPLAGKK